MSKFESLTKGRGEVLGYHPFMFVLSGTIEKGEFEDLTELVGETLARITTEELARSEHVFWMGELGDE